MLAYLVTVNMRKPKNRRYIFTYSKRKKVGQGSGGIVHNMELARLKKDVPIGRVRTKSTGDSIAEDKYAESIV